MPDAPGWAIGMVAVHYTLVSAGDLSELRVRVIDRNRKPGVAHYPANTNVSAIPSSNGSTDKILV